MFIDENIADEAPIESMPGQYRFLIERALKEVSEVGIKSVLLLCSTIPHLRYWVK
ncbi:MAG: hypothetical protein U9R10_04005 [Euryarchaeota archaeon]|nr:hypothetical protein [Euryarchaeota archaeon]